MPIAASCTCGRKIKVADKMAGKRVACPECGKPVQLPTAAAAPEPEPEMAAVAVEEREQPESPTEEPAKTERSEGKKRAAPGRGQTGSMRRAGRASGRTRAIEKPSESRGLSSAAKGSLVGAVVGFAILGSFVGYLLWQRGRSGEGATPEVSGTSGPGAPAAGPPAQNMEWGDVFRQYNESVVIVHSETGDGSGFFVDAQGVVCTNFHVVSDSFVKQGIQVRAFAKDEAGESITRTYEKVSPVYLDPSADIALLRIYDEGAGPFQPVVLDPSDKFGTGDEIAAIGSPGGGERILENTFTRGIVSQAKRYSLGADHIQIDAPINKGNSGGPVFNRKGQVIGMATWGYEGKQNLNFAVPVAAIRSALAARGSWVQDSGESDAVRAKIEGFWKGLKEEDADAVAAFLPEYVATRHLEAFQMLAMRWKATLDSWGMGKEQALKRLEDRKKDEGWLMSQLVWAHEDDKEMKIKPAEVQKFYVDLQMRIWKASGFEDFEIGNVELSGAMGKFEITVSVKDPKTGKTSKEIDSRYVYKDRGEWKFYLVPIDASDLSPYPY